MQGKATREYYYLIHPFGKRQFDLAVTITTLMYP